MTHPAHSRTVPEHIGPYEIVRKLGEGGMAETFEAVRRRPGGFSKRVCIKRILYPHSADAGFREEFLLEARVLAQLDHPGIVDAFDYDDDQGRWYLVMQLVDGIDLAKLLDHYDLMGLRMPPGVVAYVGAKVAEALHYLHHFVDSDGVPRHIVHRDVSPSNILISRGGDVKLSDLGIATFAGRPKLTRTDHTKGKLWYMSPEHIEKGRGLDGRSDLFSLGALLYEALAGARAFEHPTQIGTHHAILEGKFEPLLTHAPHLDREFAALIEHTLAADKARRPATGRELAIRLRTLAPHPAPKAALSAAVAECLQASSTTRSGEHSSPHYTGEDPLAQAAAIAASFHDPSPRPKVTTPYPSEPRVAAQAAATTSALSPSSERAASPQSAARSKRTVLWAALAGGIVLSGVGLAILSVRIPQAVHAPRAPAAASSKPETSSATTRLPLASTQTPLTSLPLALDEPPPSLTRVHAQAPPSLSLPAAKEAKTAKRGEGALKVRVMNWGYVWLDGEFKGKGPMFFEHVNAGWHDVGAGQTTDKPSRTQKVRIRPGQYLEQVIELNEPLFK